MDKNEAYVRDNGTEDDYLLCRAAVESGSTWAKEAGEFRKHELFIETTYENGDGWILDPDIG